MKLLVVTYRLPWHTYTADRYTMQHFVKHFSQRHDITLVAFAESEEEARQAEVLRPMCERVEPVVLPRWRAYANALRGIASNLPLSVWLYRSQSMADTIRQIVDEGSIDLAYVYHLRMGQYLADIDSIPRCIALQPVQILNLKRFKEHTRHPAWKLFYAIEHQRMSRYEPAIARRFDRCLLISEKDRSALDPLGRLDNVFFNPHGVDPDYFSPDPAARKEPHTIVFHGSMRYQANSNAALYFVREIYSLVKDEVPDARLHIVGFKPPPPVRALARDPSITVTGFAEDMREYLNRAQVSIDPLRVGAGLQNKVLESMSMGLPVVASTVANEGIGAVPGEHILLADEPRRFAQHIVRLFRDDAERERLGSAARAFIERNWSWEAHYAPLEELFERLVAERRPARAPQEALVGV
jgi:sugar transferase (PEP-CTERM/EpsH1 system associated)